MLKLACHCGSFCHCHNVVRDTGAGVEELAVSDRGSEVLEVVAILLLDNSSGKDVVMTFLDVVMTSLKEFFVALE